MIKCQCDVYAVLSMEMNIVSQGRNVGEVYKDLFFLKLQLFFTLLNSSLTTKMLEDLMAKSEPQKKVRIELSGGSLFEPLMENNFNVKVVVK